jgi:tetratricopeptide (TPR) repeat protein
VSERLDETAAGYAWEQAKRSSDSPRAAGALLAPHVRADEDLRKRESLLRTAVTEAERSGDPALIYGPQHRLGLHLEAMGTLEQAQQALASAVAASAQDADLSSCHAAVTNDHGIVLARLGRHEKASECFALASQFAERSGEQALTRSAQGNRGLMAWLEGRTSDCLELWDGAFRTARSADDAAANARILNNVGVLKLLEGNGDEAVHQEALRLFNRAILLAQRGGDIRGLAFTYNNLGLSFSGPPHGEHSAAIPFVEMSLALLTGPLDILARLYVLNNNIIIYEQVHFEPARKFRAQFADTLKTFTSAYPHRSADVERSVYAGDLSDSTDGIPEDDEWEICEHPVLLRAFSRCGVRD